MIKERISPVHLGTVSEENLSQFFVDEKTRVFAANVMWNMRQFEVGRTFESFSVNIENQAVRMTVIPINGSEMKVDLSEEQKEFYRALLTSSSNQSMINTSMRNNTKRVYSYISQKRPFNTISEPGAHSVNVYQIRTDGGDEAIVLLEGLERTNGELNLHTYLNSLHTDRLLDETIITEVRSGHIWGPLILLDKYCDHTNNLNLNAESNDKYEVMRAYDRRAVLSLMKYGYVCLGSDGCVMQEELVKELMTKKEQEYAYAY